jgi:hypothetical protein
MVSYCEKGRNERAAPEHSLKSRRARANFTTAGLHMAPAGGYVELVLEVRNRTKGVLQWAPDGAEQTISALSGRASARMIIQPVGSLIQVTAAGSKAFSVAASVYWTSLSYARQVDVLSTDSEVRPRPSLNDYLAFVHVCPFRAGAGWW